MSKLLAACAAALSLSACAYPSTPPALAPVTRAAAPATGAPPAQETRTPVTLLIAIDGFRPDYLRRGLTPVLNQLAAEGVTGPMRPAFPTKTFPNFWTLATGLVPDRHGIVGNTMEDQARAGKRFTMATVDPAWWNTAEPIWVTAERAGLRTASLYWPGSAVAWGGTQSPRWDNEVAGGIRPSDWHSYSEGATEEMRARTVADWLRRPATTRPRFVALYFDSVDVAGHHHGIDSAEVNAAIAATDRALGQLAAELAAMGQPTNVVIVSDHGMSPTSSERTVLLDAVLPAGAARVLEQGPLAAIYPATGQEEAVAAGLLRRHPHMRCWRKGDVPARLRYGRHPRVAPFLCLADDGWLVLRDAAARAGTNPGNHGYDNDLPSMRALFIANGPAFARGRRIGTFDNVAVAPLLRTLMGLPPGEGLDGSDAPFRGVLIREAH